MARPVPPASPSTPPTSTPTSAPTAGEAPAAPGGEHRAVDDPRVATAVLVAAYLVGGLGYAMGFNQLATQAPVDAVLPVALFSVGLVGLLTMVRRSILHRSDAARAALHRAHPPGSTSPTPGPAPVPGPDDGTRVELGVAHLAFGLAALVAVLWRWGTAAQALVVGAYGIALGPGAVRELWLARRRSDRSGAATALLDAAQAVLLIGFAWAALADAGIRPFT